MKWMFLKTFDKLIKIFMLNYILPLLKYFEDPLINNDREGWKKLNEKEFIMRLKIIVLQLIIIKIKKKKRR